MGKTTLFHPVSLHVIRGSAESCGFKLGRLTQMKLSDDGKRARYRAEVLQIPGDVGSAPAEIQESLQGCFAGDISVTRVQADSKRRLVATIETEL